MNLSANDFTFSASAYMRAGGQSSSSQSDLRTDSVYSLIDDVENA